MFVFLGVPTAQKIDETFIRTHSLHMINFIYKDNKYVY